MVEKGSEKKGIKANLKKNIIWCCQQEHPKMPTPNLKYQNHVQLK